MHRSNITSRHRSQIRINQKQALFSFNCKQAQIPINHMRAIKSHIHINHKQASHISTSTTSRHASQLDINHKEAHVPDLHQSQAGIGHRSTSITSRHRSQISQSKAGIGQRSMSITRRHRSQIHIHHKQA